MNDKQLVAIEAAKLVKNGMLVGLGTGSTANFFIEELARRRTDEGLDVTTVASSVVSTIKAQSLGLPIVALEHISTLDLYVDGADEVTNDMILLKGRGFDLVREKLLAKASKEFIVLIDPSKKVSRIGEKFPIPVEVAPFSWQLVKRSLEQIGGKGDLRPNASKDGLAITSHGSLVLDMVFGEEVSGSQLNDLLNATPGVVEHGIFKGLAKTILLADNGMISRQSA